MRRLSAIGFVLILGGLVMLAGPAFAQPKTGCPIGSGWAAQSVETTAETIWPELVDQSPWSSQGDFQESAIRPYDRNEDGSLCVKTMWGDDLNPNAQWFGISQFLVRDNTANASDK